MEKEKTESVQPKRVPWLDGLRGLAAIGILTNHFVACFCPAVLSSKLISALELSPLAVFVNGSTYLVQVFCIVTGMLAAKAILDREELRIGDQERLSDAMVKRYMRLFFPVLCMNILVFLLLKLGLMSNGSFASRVPSAWAGGLYYEYDPKSTFLTLLLDSFVKVPILGSTKYSLAYWCLPHLFYGYFLSVILAEMCWGKSARILLVYLFWWSILLLAQKDMTACFVTGTALAYWNRNRKAGKVGESIFGGILILCGMLLGGYPIYSAPRGLYQLLNHEIFRIPSYMLWHSIGSGLTFVGIILCPAVQRGLSIRPLIEAGKLSFAVYLSHIAVMSSVGTGLAVLLIDSGLSYGGLCWMVFAAVCVTVFVFSWLFHRYVEHGCEQLAGRLMRILRVPEGEKTCHSA